MRFVDSVFSNFVFLCCCFLEMSGGPTPAFLRAHYHWLGNEQELKIDLQKPSVCLEPDFLLSLLNFFFPEWNMGTTNLKVKASNLDFCDFVNV